MERNKDTEVLVNLLNSMSLKDYAEICQELEGEHRTIQQNMTRLCIEWLKVCAKDNYRFDLRNEESHKLAKRLLDPVSDKDYWDYLPYI